ncbi:microsomal glutathione S-transferase 1-like [Phymastichus coffea]|uniref:microsomal glutathione S-transferase 1-like n=1 Tax=Phymastichus coffea TaxID=108790 RepID=UPI00273AE956|nr:microsomal glutathione S-transferase 1-like [Phymastichus coffea]
MQDGYTQVAVLQKSDNGDRTTGVFTHVITPRYLHVCVVRISGACGGLNYRQSISSTKPRHQAFFPLTLDKTKVRTLGCPNDAVIMAPAYNPEIMGVFGFWTGILTLKLLSMSLLTARTRFRKKVVANHEDAMMLGKVRVAYDDVDVERVRRSHLNDLENILPWVAITYIYLGTAPANWFAALLIRGFVLSRIGHTLSYAIFPKQPFRAITFFIGFSLTAFEAAATIYYYL